MGSRPNYFYLDQLVPIGERSKSIVETRRKDAKSIVDEAVKKACSKPPAPGNDYVFKVCLDKKLYFGLLTSSSSRSLESTPVIHESSP